MNGFDITNNVNLSSPEAVRQIWSYVLSLQEQVEYWLRNLDAENFNETGLKEIAGMFKADTIISNTNITQEIYADYGIIADLTVDKLRTDYTKAQKYLKGDKGDVNYIYIHDETISFITAATDGSASEQLVDGDRKFYWEDDTHAQMTSEKVTDYPVMVYKYAELVKMQIAFTTITLPDGTSSVMPVVTLGAGTGSGDSGKAFLYKATDGLYMDYHAADGKTKRAALTDAGVFISPYQFTALDVYTNGFIANYAGDKVSMKWTTDASGRITSLTDASGSVTTVTWHDTAM